MGIGRRIKELRKRAGMTQTQIAAATGVNPSMIAQIERETKTVSLQLGKAIAKALGVDIMEIIGRD